jgi:hypothetical protein
MGTEEHEKIGPIKRQTEILLRGALLQPQTFTLILKHCPRHLVTKERSRKWKEEQQQEKEKRRIRKEQAGHHSFFSSYCL